MADLNKMLIIGRLTRDPRFTPFQSGGVTEFGVATRGERRRDKQTGEYKDDPLFLDCKAFANDQGKGAGGVIRDFARKGELIFLEGHLVLERWKKGDEDRSRVVLVVDNVQLLTPRSKETDPVQGARSPLAQPKAQQASTRDASQKPQEARRDASTYAGGYKAPPPPQDRQGPARGLADDDTAYPDEPGYNRRPEAQDQIDEESLPF